MKRFLVLTGINLTRSAKVDLKESMGNFLLYQDDIEVFRSSVNNEIRNVIMY